MGATCANPGFGLDFAERPLRSWLTPLVIVLLLVGCSPAPVTDCDAGGLLCDAGNSDAGQILGTDAGTDGGDGWLIIHGNISYEGAATIVEPSDLVKDPVSVWIPVDNSLEAVEVQVISPGEARARVPVGSIAYIGRGAKFLVTTEREVDLGYSDFGRPLTAPGSAKYPAAELDLQTFIPDSGTTSFNLFSAEGGEFGWFEQVDGGMVSNHFIANAFYSPWTTNFDPSRGDVGRIIQYQFQYLGVPGYSEGKAVASGQPDALDLTTDPISIKATLSQNPMRTVSVRQPFNPFTAEISNMGQGGAYGGQTCNVYGRCPGCVRTIDLYEYTSNYESDLDCQAEFHDPVPGDWDRLVETGVYVWFPRDAPGGAGGGVYGWLDQAEPLNDGSDETRVLTLSPPRAVAVDGSPAAYDLVVSNPTPELSWESPVLGTANGYVAYVWELGLDSSGYSEEKIVAEIWTAELHMKVPPGVLKSGHSYCIQLDAAKGSGPQRPSSAPFYAFGVGVTASFVTGVIVPQ